MVRARTIYNADTARSTTRQTLLGHCRAAGFHDSARPPPPARLRERCAGADSRSTAQRDCRQRSCPLLARQAAPASAWKGELGRSGQQAAIEHPQAHAGGRTAPAFASIARSCRQVFNLSASAQAPATGEEHLQGSNHAPITCDCRQKLSAACAAGRPLLPLYGDRPPRPPPLHQ